MCTVKFGVYAPPCTPHSFQMGGGGGAFTPNSDENLKYTPMYHFCAACLRMLCTSKYVLSRVLFVLCIQLQYKPLSTLKWYKLWGWAYTLFQITPLQEFGAEKQVGVYSRVGLYSEFYGTCTYNDDD